MVGHKYGVLRWSKTGSKCGFSRWLVFLPLKSYNLFTLLHLIEKTVEGTAAGITSVLAACSVLLATTGYIFTQVGSAFSLSLSHTHPSKQASTCSHTQRNGFFLRLSLLE